MTVEPNEGSAGIPGAFCSAAGGPEPNTDEGLSSFFALKDEKGDSVLPADAKLENAEPAGLFSFPLGLPKLEKGEPSPLLLPAVPLPKPAKGEGAGLPSAGLANAPKGELAALSSPPAGLKLENGEAALAFPPKRVLWPDEAVPGLCNGVPDPHGEAFAPIPPVCPKPEPNDGLPKLGAAAPGEDTAGGAAELPPNAGLLF